MHVVNKKQKGPVAVAPVAETPYRDAAETEEARLEREVIQLRAALARHKEGLAEARTEARDAKLRVRMADACIEGLEKRLRRRRRGDLAAALAAALFVLPAAWCFDAAPRQAVGLTIAALALWMLFWRTR